MFDGVPMDKKILVTTNMRKSPSQGKIVMNKKQMRRMLNDKPVKFDKRYR